MANAIKKYGWNNVITEILEDNIPSQEEANQLEIEYIAEYDSRNPEKGYNVGIGGGIINKCDDERILALWNEGYTQVEIKERLSYAVETIRLYLDEHGITHQDRIQRLREFNSKNLRKFDRQQIYNLWQENKSYAEIMNLLNCSRDTIRRALEEYQVNGLERAENGKLMAKKNKTDSKPVHQYDLNNNYIQTFQSIAEANRALGKASNASNIIAVCKGNRKQAYGFKWAYA